MTKIIDEIQIRLAEAQKRLAETSQQFQAAQQAQAVAQHNFNVWNMAMQVEQRDEQLRLAVATKNQLPLPNASPEAQAVATVSDAQPESTDSPEAVNKTDMVRVLLSRHPTGMTATEIWKEVNAQFKHRPYLYSVLKRLRDHDEVIKRRSKYCLKVVPRADEIKEQHVVQ